VEAKVDIGGAIVELDVDVGGLIMKVELEGDDGGKIVVELLIAGADVLEAEVKFPE
jgi:hypothetical protein